MPPRTKCPAVPIIIEMIRRLNVHNRAAFYLFLIFGLLFFSNASAKSRNLNPEKYILAFSPRTGQALIYYLASQMNSEGQSFLGINIGLSANTSGEIDFAVRSVSPESVFVALSSPGILVFLKTLDAQNRFTLSAPEDHPVEVIFGKTGRIREVRNIEALEKQNLMNFSVLDVLQNCLPTFPDKQVSINDSWQDHKRMLIPFQGMNLILDLDIIFLLNDVLPSPEGRTALIQANYTVTLSGSRKIEELMGSFEGKGSGSGNLIFLMDQGYFTRYGLNYSLNGSMIMRNAEKDLMKWPFSLTFNADLILMEKRKAQPRRAER